MIENVSVVNESMNIEVLSQNTFDYGLLIPLGINAVIIAIFVQIWLGIILGVIEILFWSLPDYDY